LHNHLRTQLTNFSMSKLVEHVSKKPVPDHQKNVIFEITAEDQNEEDVEIPYVMVKLRK
jgi:ubiquitin-activating enzyme E1